MPRPVKTGTTIAGIVFKVSVATWEGVGEVISAYLSLFLFVRMVSFWVRTLEPLR